MLPHPGSQRCTSIPTVLWSLLILAAQPDGPVTALIKLVFPASPSPTRKRAILSLWTPFIFMSFRNLIVSSPPWLQTSLGGFQSWLHPFNPSEISFRSCSSGKVSKQIQCERSKSCRPFRSRTQEGSLIMCLGNWRPTTLRSATVLLPYPQHRLKQLNLMSGTSCNIQEPLTTRVQ